jgi:hypothetical protein
LLPDASAVIAANRAAQCNPKWRADVAAFKPAFHSAVCRTNVAAVSATVRSAVDATVLGAHRAAEWISFEPAELRTEFPTV